MRSHTGYRRPSRLRTRSRQVLSLLEVLAVAVFTLALLPVVVSAQEVPDVLFTEPGERTLRCGFTGDDAFLDETIYCQMRVGNGTPIDANVFLFVTPESIEINKCPDQGRPGFKDDLDLQGNCANGADRVEVPRADPDFRTFLDFWRIHVESQSVLTRALPEERDVRYLERKDSCERRPLLDYDAGGPTRTDTTRMCSMGVVRGLETNRWAADSNEPTYERQYFVGMTLLNDADMDQTRFGAWELVFDYVVRLRVPHDDTCPSTRLNGICLTPLYERP